MSTRCTTPRLAAAAAAAAARRPSRPRARPAARAITCAPAPHLLTQPACSRAAQAQLEFFQSRLIDSLEQKQRAMARQVGFKHGRRPADPAKGDAKGGEGDAKRAKVVSLLAAALPAAASRCLSPPCTLCPAAAHCPASVAAALACCCALVAARPSLAAALTRRPHPPFPSLAALARWARRRPGRA